MRFIALGFLLAAAHGADTGSAFPGGLGPLRQALAEAKAWQKDACLSGVEFLRSDSRDVFTLSFHSDTQPKESFNYATGGPAEGGRPGPKKGWWSCLPAFELDAKAAIEAATAAGLAADGTGDLSAGLSFLEAEAARLFKKRGKTIKPYKPGAVWYVSAADSCSIVDARNGKVLYVGGRFGGCP